MKIQEAKIIVDECKKVILPSVVYSRDHLPYEMTTIKQAYFMYLRYLYKKYPQRPLCKQHLETMNDIVYSFSGLNNSTDDNTANLIEKAYQYREVGMLDPDNEDHKIILDRIDYYMQRKYDMKLMLEINTYMDKLYNLNPEHIHIIESS